MILRSVELESFGRFRGQTVEFRRGLNLVIGPNEAGKSTIAEAVPAVLFGTDHLERFKPWGRNSCSASLFFEGRGHTVEIKRNLITDEVELVEKDDLYHVRAHFSGKAPFRGRSASCREYRALLEKLIGVSDEKLFRATYFFGHHPLRWSGDELALKLRTLVGGTAEADYAEILDTLLDEHFQLTSSNPWGRDKQRDREYEAICNQLNGQRGDESIPVFVEFDNSPDIEGEILKLAEELEFDRQEYAKGLRYIERFRAQAERQKEQDPDAEDPPVQDVEPPVQNLGSFAHNALSEKLAAVGLPATPPRDLPDLLAEASDIRQELAALQQPYSILNSREKKTPAMPWMVIGSLLTLFAAGAFGAWWTSYNTALSLTAAGVCSTVLMAWGAWRYVTREKALAACRKDRNRLDQQKMAAQQRQSDLSERCDALGLPSSAIDLVRLQKQVSTHRALLDQFWAAADLPEDEVLSAPDENTAVSEPVSLIATDLAVASETLEECAAVQELQDMEARMTEFAAQLEEKEARLQQLRVQLEQDSLQQATSDNPPEVALLKRKREIEERIAVLRKAINLLAEAVDEFGRSHLVRLNEEAGKMFGKITGGRYSEIKLDEDMSPSVQVDSRRWMPVDHFSRGTVDAIYLTLRMSLAKLRDDGRSLPLMLDDPFVHLDQKRLAKTLNLIDMASANGQLIMFSHNLDLGKRAARERWHVVPLDGDSADTNPDEGGEHAGQLHLL